MILPSPKISFNLNYISIYRAQGVPVPPKSPKLFHCYGWILISRWVNSSMNSYYLYVLYLQDVARRKKESNSEHHTISKTAKSCSSFLLPNKRPVAHLNSKAIRNSANIWDTATANSAMWVSTVAFIYSLKTNSPRKTTVKPAIPISNADNVEEVR